MIWWEYRRKQLMNKIIILYVILKISLVFIFIVCLSSKYNNNNIIKKDNIKIALCTMGKKENLYAREFMDYYIKLGVDHMFIYDNNDPLTEKIEDVLDKKYREKITFYQTKNLNISFQKEAFTDCYNNNILFIIKRIIILR